MSFKSFFKRHAYLKASVIIITFSLVCLNIALVKNISKIHDNNSLRQNEATWFIFQLHKEFSALNYNIDLFAKGINDYDDVFLSYELTWSRFDVLIHSDEIKRLKDYQEVDSFARSAFDNFKRAERMLNTININPDMTALFKQEMADQYANILNKTNEYFQINNPLVTWQSKNISHQYKLLTYSAVATLILCLLIVFLFWDDIYYHEQLSLQDTLTNLQNRTAMNQELDLLEQSLKPFTLFLLDINEFKQVNDRYGHLTGDKLLTAMAERLRLTMPEKINIYRTGGDEFVILNRAIDDMTTKSTEQRTREVINRPFKFDNMQVRISLALGYARYPSDSDDINTVINIADKRMYEDKHSQKRNQIMAKNL